ncbi:MAG: NupC/NupG family nucleoside CNT transporter [Leptolyngbyaceae cyanobacterium SM1_3_5]|nr:NupC/NupG family nucleoside CNT transporter [Leptolyngbyaceae cyanobacterium SM1_3_5]
MERLISLLGQFVFTGLAYLLSIDRRAIRWTPVLWGIAIQLVFAVLILRVPFIFTIFSWLGGLVGQFLDFTDAGASFVFGENFRDFFFAFKVLPTIIFFSSFIAVLYHYGVLQRIVGLIAAVMIRTMKTSGSESLSAAGNIFVGQTEAPLLIKPYVPTMTQSELHAVMTGGFATISGGVMAAYISFGIPAEHLIAASVMSAPAALAISKMMYPETEQSPTAGEVTVKVERTSANAIDAAASGALDGLRLALNVGAIIIAFLALLAMFNALLGWAGGLFGFPTLSLEFLLSFLLAPIAWLMGIPWADCGAVGTLLGKRTILNEFIAYVDLQALIEQNAISERAIIIATYALCGFANIGSIGIQIGGIGGIAPNRQSDLARLGVRAMIGGTLACFMTATIAGLLL